MENNTLTVGVCSDTHYWFGGPNFENESLQLQSHSDLLLDTLITELSNAELDIVLHLGDMTSGGGTFNMPEADFHQTLDKATQRFKQLGSPVHALPGNHDCVVGRNWAEFEALWSLEPGRGKTVDVANARLILVNAQGHCEEQISEASPYDPVYGHVTEAELNRVEGALATAGDRAVLLFIHQLLKPWCNNPDWGQDRPYRKYYSVKNRQPVLDLIAEYGNVKAVIQGHAHRLDAQQIRVGTDEVLFVVLPSLIEFPLGWLKLAISQKSLEMELRTLPLQELAALSEQSGRGQSWRAGKEEWRYFAMPL